MKLKWILLVGLGVFALSACEGSVGSTVEKAGASPSSQAVDQGSSGSTGSHLNIQVVTSGFTQTPPDSANTSYVSYAAVLKNPNSQKWVAENVSVNLTFTEGSGTVVKSASENISMILPGQTMAVGTTTPANNVTKVDVQALVGSWEQINSESGAFTVAGVNTGVDPYAHMTTKGTVNSTFAKDLKFVHAVAVYYNDKDEVIGGAFTYLDFVPAGGKIGFEIQSYPALGNVAKTEVYVSPSSLSLSS